MRQLLKKIQKPWQRVLFGLAAFFLLIFLFWAAFTPRPPLLDGVSFSTVVLDRHGRLMRLSLAEDERYRVYTPLSEMSSDLLEATLLYEDRHFYRHPGINPASVLRAAWETYAGGGRRMGASTITMQLARLRLGLDTGGMWGKLRQMERALAYELHYSKDEILEAYLNLAPYGGNIEGCGAAGRIYYGKGADKLSLAESLSLVSVPQNPARRNPLAVRRMDRAGQVDRALEEAQERIFNLWVERHPEDAGTEFLARSRIEPGSPADLPFTAPHVSTEAVLRYGGRLPVKTTIDSRLQNQVEQIINSMIARNRHSLDVNNASAMLLHWPTMEVRALAGSADFYDAGIEGQVDGTRARRSPGSTLKPFIFALALDQGLIHPKTLLYDTPQSFGGYDPENADQEFRGPVSATEALRDSRNIPAIYLANNLKKPDLYGFLRDSGVKFDFERDHYGLALVLGGAEVSMRELATLYAMLANRGELKQVVLFEEERASAPEPRRLLSPEACVLTLDMIRALPVRERMRSSAMVTRTPMYWKTGTSNGYRDAWTAGVFGPYVLVVWVGNFDNSPNTAFVGMRTAAPLFWDIAEAIYTMERVDDLPMHGIDDLNIKKVRVCSGTGDIDTRLCPDKTEAYFIPGVSPIANSGVYREILIDKATGQRACVEAPGETERVVWEFWPTDLQRMFRVAGIAKPGPPPFLPECGADDAPGGLPPEIISPRQGITYHRSISRPEGTVITLRASGDADVTDFYWFSGKEFIGRSAPGEEIVWTPPGGRVTVRVVDNFGRSQSRAITVELTD